MEDSFTHDAENGPGRKHGHNRRDGRQQQKHTCKFIICSQLFSVFCFAIGIAGGILIGIYVYHGGPDDKDDKVTPNPLVNVHQAKTNPQPTSASVGQSVKEEPKHCSRRNPVKHSNYEDSLYAPLTTDEMDRIAKYLNDANIISTTEVPTSLRDTFILYQSVLPPVKSDALRYLDEGGSKPSRNAKVTVQRGGASPPDIMEYKVGPLGANGPLTSSEITKPGDILFNTRPYEFLELAAMENIVKEDLKVLEPLIKESFDNASYPDDLYLNFLNGPPNPNGNERETR